MKLLLMTMTIKFIIVLCHNSKNSSEQKKVISKSGQAVLHREILSPLCQPERICSQFGFIDCLCKIILLRKTLANFPWVQAFFCCAKNSMSRRFIGD